MPRRRARTVAAPSPILRVLRGALIVAIILAAILVAAGAALTYSVTTSKEDTESVSPASYLLTSYENLSFKDRDGAEHEGWLLLGLKRAPVIVLCHGYNSNRSELLPLGMALRENHFNVYLFNFKSSPAKRPFNSLGVDQAAQTLSAINAVLKQADVNPHRVGLYGPTTGGYAAIWAAQQDSRVKALVADAIYDDPDQMFNVQLDRILGGSSPLFRFVAEREFHLFAGRQKALRLTTGLGKMNEVPKLFISGRDQPLLATTTEDLYNAAPQPKRLLVLERSQAGLTSETEKKEYESQILTFFLQNLRLRAD